MHPSILLLALGLPLGPAHQPTICRLPMAIDRVFAGEVGPTSALGVEPLVRGSVAPKYGPLSVPSASSTQRTTPTVEAPPDAVALLRAARSVLRVVGRSSPGIDATAFRR